MSGIQVLDVMTKRIPIQRQETIWYNATEKDFEKAKQMSLFMIDMQLEEGTLTEDLAELLKEVWENDPEWDKDEESGKSIMIQRMTLKQYAKYKALWNFANLAGDFDEEEEKEPEIH